MCPTRSTANCTSNLISATYAGNQNVRRVVLNAAGTAVVQEVNLGNFSEPLDVTTDALGIIYVAEHGGDQITLLIPDEAAMCVPIRRWPTTTATASATPTKH